MGSLQSLVLSSDVVLAMCGVGSRVALDGHWLQGEGGGGGRGGGYGCDGTTQSYIILHVGSSTEH